MIADFIKIGRHVVLLFAAAASKIKLGFSAALPPRPQ
jgi:hypothetical protein